MPFTTRALAFSRSRRPPWAAYWHITLRIKSVAAIAKTPSLKASSRFGDIVSVRPLDEFDDDTLWSLNVEADRAVKRAARLVDRERAARDDADACRDQPLAHGGQVIDGERDVHDGPVVEPKSNASAPGLPVFDQLDDPSIARVEVGDVELDGFESQQGRGLRIAVGSLRQEPQSEQIPVERKGAIEVGSVDADMVDPGNGHGLTLSRRGGMRSRAKTSSIVSARLTSSA